VTVTEAVPYTKYQLALLYDLRLFLGSRTQTRAHDIRVLLFEAFKLEVEL
jgi:hypothetical protein